MCLHVTLAEILAETVFARLTSLARVKLAQCKQNLARPWLVHGQGASVNRVIYLEYRQCNSGLKKYPNLINDRFTQNFILEALKIVLNNNTFSFDDKHYLQTKGTDMGTKVAPTYATLTLGYLELQTEILNLWGEDSANYISKHWKRFLDDCFIIWNEDDERLYTFYNILNKLDPNIKFTMEESTDKIPFLDVLVKKQDTK